MTHQRKRPLDTVCTSCTDSIALTVYVLKLPFDSGDFLDKYLPNCLRFKGGLRFGIFFLREFYSNSGSDLCNGM